MKVATAELIFPEPEAKDLRRWIDRPFPTRGGHSSLKLMHCTTTADGRPGSSTESRNDAPVSWPAGLDHIAVERAAREMRSRHVAEMVRRLLRNVAKGIRRMRQTGVVSVVTDPGTYAGAVKHIADWLRHITRSNSEIRRERRERYLAQATDLCDLERRMRELDRLPMSISTWH